MTGHWNFHCIVLYSCSVRCCSVRTEPAGSDKPVTDDDGGGGGGWMQWRSLISLLVMVDLVWFAHRMACTYSTVKLLLYGQMAYIECRPITAGARSSRAASLTSTRSQSGFKNTMRRSSCCCYFFSGKGAKYYDEYVCLFVCLSVRSHLENC